MPRRTEPSRPIHSEEAPFLPVELVKRRRILGACLAIATVVLLIALVTYDWRDIRWLSNPPSHPEGITANRIGILGAWLTFFGYSFAGLAYRYFALPLMTVLAAFLLHGRVHYFRLRVLWILLFYITLACLFQTYGGDDGLSIPLLSQLNLRPNAGGAVGQCLVTGLLRPFLGTLGIQLLLWPLAIFLLMLIVGLRNCVLLAVRLTAPRDPTPQPSDAHDLRDDLRYAAQAPKTHPASDMLAKSLGLFSIFFHRKTVEAAEQEDVRDLLRKRTPQQQESLDTPWQPPRAPIDEPLFVRPEAPPPPPPLTLTADDTPVLKPVSPDRAQTAPVPAGNDNDLAPEPTFEHYGLPSTDLLDPIPPRASDVDDVQSSVAAIESVFQQFGIAAHVVGHIRGPVLTQFEIRPAPGVKVEKFKAYERNLLMALRAESIRIQAPIPGRDVVGIEVPNTVRQSVTLREILEGKAWHSAKSKMALPLALGKLATGGDLIVDLAEMPHLLVAGGTGSGKSVSINDMLVGLLMCRRPEQLRLLMVDPKRVEFTVYDNLPHLLNPVVVDAKKVLFSLRWAQVEMNRRYKLFQRYGVRDIGVHNRRVDLPEPNKDNPTVKLPYIVIVIDELAELMIEVKADIEPVITSLTQKARAAGIHMIIATQRPTTDIVTGTIKANIPGRIGLRVSQANDSRTILDETGAENLIGKGDMLLKRSGKPTVRSQAAWVSDNEIPRVCDFIKEQAGPAFDHVLASNMERIQEERANDDISALVSEFTKPEPGIGDGEVDLGPEEDKSDEGYYQRALELIRQTGRFSTSALQRRLGIGYNKAGRISDMLEERGIIGPAGKAGSSREILVDLNAMAREQLAGTDAEAAAFDTRTASLQEAPPAEPAPTAEYTYEPLGGAPDAPSAQDDFDLGDWNPESLDAPDIIHPKGSGR